MSAWSRCFAALLALSCTWLGACGSAPSRPSPVTTTETLEGAMVTPAGEYLVALTDTHDYVFKQPHPVVPRVITSELHRYASAKFGRFVVDHQSTTEGAVTLRLHELPQPLRAEAESLGFSREPDGDYVVEVVLAGQSYKRARDRVKAIKLNQSYAIEIQRDPRAERVPSKSPLNSVGANVVGIFVLPLLLITGPFNDYWR